MRGFAAIFSQNIGNCRNPPPPQPVDANECTIKLDGKPQSYGIQTLAADGKSYTDVSWSAGKASEKQTGFYVKQ